MRRYLVNDLVAMEDVCNAKCSYCITGSSNFKDKHHLGYYEDKLEFNLEKLLDDENSYRDGKQLKERLDRVTEILKEETQPLILKLSGGEIFLIKGIEEFIKQQAPFYKRIQVLTNGTLLNKHLLKTFSEIPNFSLQISIDGHTLALNRLRTKSESLQKKICKVLELCHDYQIKLEINCVLTSTNVEGIYDFANYLKKYDNVLLLPYAVRGKFRERFFPKQNQLGALKRVTDNYEQFESILPPKVYLEELLSFLQTGERKMGCHLPGMIYQSFDDGIISPCPNIWYKSLGNILEDKKRTLANLKDDPFYDLLNRENVVLEQCKKCFTPWDLLNLFCKGKIDLSELSNIYLYSDPDILAYLENLKNQVGGNNENRNKI